MFYFSVIRNVSSKERTNLLKSLCASPLAVFNNLLTLVVCEPDACYVCSRCVCFFLTCGVLNFVSVYLLIKM